MEKQKTRDQIEDKYKWDLTTIFKNDNEFLAEYEKVKQIIPEISNYKGKILKSSDDLYNYLEYSDALERRIYKLHYYANLTYDQDTTNTLSQKNYDMVNNLLANYNEMTSFVMPELMSVSYDKILKYIDKNPKLKKYKFNLGSIYRYKDHTLDYKSEELLSKFTKVFSSPEESYSSLADSDMTFGNIIVDGKEVELTSSNYSVYIRSNDRSVRKQAFERLHQKYADNKHVITNLFKTNIEVLIKSAQIRGYNSSLEASLYSDNIDRSVYDNLIDTVSSNLDVSYKYFDLKKKCLGVDELHNYDLYVDMVGNLDKSYTFEDAKSIVLEALKPLGEDYIENLNKAFDERWIDVYNNKGKRSGAYSSGFYDTKPFVLLNFEGKLDDVSTLAHELGHSMHTYYSCQNNEYNNSHYKIFVAEVASTVNELLLAKHLLKESNDKIEKCYILNQLMELFKATIYRQVMFAEFERDMHKMLEDEIPLTHESISEYYYKLNEKYYGDGVVLDDLIRYEWERIPHFYYDFYVYKYAIGLSCACFIVENILSFKDKNAENYKKFLKSGGSDYPANELKLAGIDVTSKELIESAIKMFDEFIEQFKNLKNIK